MSATSPKDGGRRQFATAITWRVGLVVLLIALASVLVVYMLQEGQSKAQRDADITSRNLTLVLSDTLSGTFDQIDLVLNSAAYEIERQTAERETGVDARTLNDLLSHNQKLIVPIISLRATDSNGNVRYGSGTEGETVNISDRDHFTRQRDGTDGMVVGQPVLGRIDKRWVLPVSRRINDAQGKFAGVTVALISIDYLEKVFSAINTGQHGAVILFDGERNILARYPEPKGPGSVVGLKIGSPEFQDLFRAGYTEATYQATSTTDGIHRTYSYHKLGYFPLFIMVGMAEDDYLADWHSQRLWIFVLYGVFVVAVLAVSTMLFVAQGRRATALAALSASESRLRLEHSFMNAIFSSITGLVVVIDRQGRLVRMNRAAEEFTGYSLDEACAPFFWRRFLPPEQRDRVEEVFQKATSADVTCRYENEWFRRDGSRRLFDWSNSIVRDADGRMAYLVTIGIDITDRLRAEQEIRLLLTKQQAILNGTPIGIAIIDLNRRIQEVNPFFCSMFRCSHEASVGNSTRILYATDEDYDEIGRRAYQTIQAGDIFGDDVLMRRGDGEDIWVRLMSRLIDQDRPDLGVVWTFEDITARKAMELELARSNTELEQFAYVASHDLRQPLRMVSSYLGIVASKLGPGLPDDIRTCIDFAVDGAKRMDALILGLLEYSRVGRASEIDAVALDIVVAEAIDNLSVVIKDSEAEIVVATKLPTVLGDRIELMRLFQNLIGNAVKYRAKDRIPHVEIRCQESGAEWQLSVADNGIGIAPEDRDRAFALFQRLVGREHYEGTGIGLAVCKKIVEHHGGKIWVESQIGKGCTFCLTLPAAGDQTKEAAICR